MDIRLAWHCSGIFWAVFAVIEKAVFKRSACCADHIVTDNTAISTHFSLVNLKITHTGPHTPPPKKTKQQKKPKQPNRKPKPKPGVLWFQFSGCVLKSKYEYFIKKKTPLFVCGSDRFFFLMFWSLSVSLILEAEKKLLRVNICTGKNTLKCNTWVWVAFLGNNTELLIFSKRF